MRVTFTDGDEGFGQIFPRFNEKLLRLGLLLRQMYADSNLLRANVSGRNLSPSSMSVEEFKDKAVEENGLFVLREWKVEEGGEEKRACRRLRLNFAVCEASGDSYAIYGYIDDGLAYKMCLGASLSPINSPEEPDARKYFKSLHRVDATIAIPHWGFWQCANVGCYRGHGGYQTIGLWGGIN